MPSDKRQFGQEQPPLNNPFEGLSSAELPLGHSEPSPAESEPSEPARPSAPPRNRGRVEIRRLKAGRGGKTVTAVSGFVGIGLAEKEKLAKQMQKSCGTGGTVKDGQIEIQGDKRQEAARILIEAGFRPVMAGG